MTKSGGSFIASAFGPRRFMEGCASGSLPAGVPFFGFFLANSLRLLVFTGTLPFGYRITVKPWFVLKRLFAFSFSGSFLSVFCFLLRVLRVSTNRNGGRRQWGANARTEHGGCLEGPGTGN